MRIFIGISSTWDGDEVVRVFVDRSKAQTWLDARPADKRGDLWRVEEWETEDPAEGLEPAAGRVDSLERTAPVARPVCYACKDTHARTIRRDGYEDQVFMCTSCPTPCQKCRAGGNGPFCETTPCSCECHLRVRRTR